MGGRQARTVSHKPLARNRVREGATDCDSEAARHRKCRSVGFNQRELRRSRAAYHMRRSGQLRNLERVRARSVGLLMIGGAIDWDVGRGVRRQSDSIDHALAKRRRSD